MEGSQWEKLEDLKGKNEILEVTIDEITKGGFIASSKDGVLGFLPNSHVSFSLEPHNLVGNKLKVIILELDRPTRRVIFSQKQTTDVKDFENEVKNLVVGQKLKANIINVAPFGIFASVALDKEKVVEGFLHISEVSWENVSDLSSKFSPGDEVETSFLGVDKDARRINLSIKRLSGDPFESLAKDYPVDKKVSGTVSKVIPAGLLVELGGGINGIIKKDKIPPTVSFKEGDSVEATVLGIDQRSRRIALAPVLKEKPIGYR
jgi:small subunit ribosomal protein S1